jgi:pyridoxamine 5'-phosphate oxidase
MMIELAIANAFEHNNLSAIYNNILPLLQQGVQATSSPWANACLATSNALVRTIIVRKVTQQYVQLHTDYRSPKVTEVSHSPAASIVWYVKDYRLQVKLSGTTTVNYNNEITALAWANMPLRSKLVYTAAAASGQIIAAPQIIDLNIKQAESHILEQAYNNFAVLQLYYHTIDVLWLNHKSNKRCQFTDNGSIANWVGV